MQLFENWRRIVMLDVNKVRGGNGLDPIRAEVDEISGDRR